MSGLIVGGVAVPVDVPVITWRDDSRLKCATRPRSTWCRQVILHKTIADDPEQVLPGAGPAGGALDTIAAWQGGLDGAHIVVDYDGTAYQLADLKLTETFHATASNAWSVGIEMKEKPGGGVYQATLDAAVAITLAACDALAIARQMPPLGSYTGHPIPRMSDTGATPGGPDMVGIFAHRDNTERRGRWDPGDVVFQMLAARDVAQRNFATRGDLAYWMTVQQDLIARRYLNSAVDGIPGPATIAALRLSDAHG